MKRQLIIGLPKSGKTTFLAALWALLNSVGAETALEVDGMAGERSHLQLIAEKWLAGQEMGRTDHETMGWVELFLRPVGSETGTIALSLPDLSGEEFQAQWRDRRCSQDYLDAARESDGVLLFMHSVELKKSVSLAKLRSEMRKLSPTRSDASTNETTRVVPSAAAQPAADAGPHGASRIPYNPDLSASQLKLIDLLQILTEPMLLPRRRRLAIVISAWDLIRNMDRTPGEHLAQLMPMLDQYLASNPDSFDVRVFGVSCEGTDRQSKDFKASVGRLPEERIKVVDGVEVGYDLTRLLNWASGDG